MRPTNSLSDIMQGEIIRHDGIAEIIIDHYDPDDFPDDPQNWMKPVRLIGFSTEASKTDLEIYEEGWDYYQALKHEVEKMKAKDEKKKSKRKSK